MKDKIALDIGEAFGSPWGRDGSGGLALGDLVSVAFNAGIALAGVIVIFLFIFGGLGVIRGAGSNDPKAAAQGKQALTYALIGFVVVFAAYWIVRIFEVITGTAFLTSPINFSPPSGGSGSGPF